MNSGLEVRHTLVYHSRPPDLNMQSSSDATVLNHLESWEASKETPSITNYLSKIHKFQKNNTTGAYRLATSNAGSTDGSGRANNKQPITSDFVFKITKAFQDSLYAVLDGLVPLVMESSIDDAKRKMLMVRAGNVGEAGKPLKLEEFVSRCSGCSASPR